MVTKESLIPAPELNVSFNLDKLLKAMDDFAEYQSIRFIEWSARNGWESYVDEDRWICISQSRDVITTQQLYQLFKNDKIQTT